MQAAVTEVQAVRCPSCGRESDADAKRCGACGKPIPDSARPLGALPPAVRITAIDLSIGELLALLVKLTIAALPIIIFCGIVGAACNVMTHGTR